MAGRGRGASPLPLPLLKKTRHLDRIIPTDVTAERWSKRGGNWGWGQSAAGLVNGYVHVSFVDVNSVTRVGRLYWTFYLLMIN